MVSKRKTFTVYRVFIHCKIIKRYNHKGKGELTMKSEFKLIRRLKWEEVFLFWYLNEGENPSWQKLAMERGFASWAEWRLCGYADRFDCMNADWGLYQIDKPAEVIAGMYGGPFRTWIEKYYGGEVTKKFVELAEMSEIVAIPTIQAMKNNFPDSKVITVLTVGGKNFVIEGMHRSCALALMNHEGRELDKPLILAIGKSKLESLPTVGRNTA